MLIDTLQVGSKVRATMGFPSIGVMAGEIGWVYEAYTIGRHRGVSVIFENGGHDGFGKDEIEWFLEDMKFVHPLYCAYSYNHISEVDTDYKTGFWRFDL